MTRVRPNRRRQPKREWPALPHLPRLSINWRRLFAVTASIGMLAGCAAVAVDLFEWPVRRLEIEGSFQHVTRYEIEAAALPALDRSLLRLDLPDIRRRVAAITWVDKVWLERAWPSTLRIRFREHRAAARWGETGLLNTRGELFTEDASEQYLDLPVLAGPEGSHRRVVARYLQVRDRLADTHLTLESIRMDARGAFTIDLANGLSVRIGRDDIDRRIDRFFSVVVPALEGEIENASYVDMRYASAFAVGWREQSASPAQLARLDTGG